jgi:uncharacterized protein YndB with AHSA1/START domain
VASPPDSAIAIESIESRSDVRSQVIAASATQVFAALRDPGRRTRWWGPAGLHSTIHRFAFEPQALRRRILQGPDGRSYPNVYRLLRFEPVRWIEIEHLSDGHHSILSIALREEGTHIVAAWRQTFDSAAHLAPLAGLLAEANAQLLARLAREVCGAAGAA